MDPQVFHLTLDEAGALVPEQRLVLRLGTSCLLEEGLQLEELRNCPVDTLPGDARRVFALFLLFFFFNEGFMVVSCCLVFSSLRLRFSIFLRILDF